MVVLGHNQQATEEGYVTLYVTSNPFLFNHIHWNQLHTGESCVTYHTIPNPFLLYLTHQIQLHILVPLSIQHKSSVFSSHVVSSWHFISHFPHHEAFSARSINFCYIHISLFTLIHKSASHSFCLQLNDPEPWSRLMFICLFVCLFVCLIGWCNTKKPLKIISPTNKMKLSFRPWFCTVRLYWTWDNLGLWDEFLYESCPKCRFNHSTCWPAVQCTTIMLRLPLYTLIRYRWWHF